MNCVQPRQRVRPRYCSFAASPFDHAHKAVSVSSWHRDFSLQESTEKKAEREARGLSPCLCVCPFIYIYARRLSAAYDGNTLRFMFHLGQAQQMQNIFTRYIIPIRNPWNELESKNEPD